ncbi:MAG TPA: cyanophycinase [Verrucomicrobiae bacterium]|nr:cyanophycinase [Verrucomicrobiae bacterium]
MTNRRKFPRSPTARHGHLVIIGGGEDRTGSKQILRRFIDLAGGQRSKIAVLTAASTEPEEIWRVYDRAFSELGVRQCVEVAVPSREVADSPDVLAALDGADAVFITGGDQKRLLAMLGGTKLDFALHDAFTSRGICIGGTSAGASAMSEHMLAEGTTDDHHPHKGMALLAAGFGFLPRVIVDQHFSQRRRLVRLLSAVAQNPYLLGVGIDEDTALVIRRNSGLEIVGEGAVTLVDGTHMTSNILDAAHDEHLELLNIRLHLLPAGCSYYEEDRKGKQGRQLPEALLEAIAILGAVS